MSLLRRLAGPCLFVLMCAAPALAQTPTRENPFPELQEARRWGPFMVVPRFKIDNIGYDNNVFLTSSNAVDFDGNPIKREGAWVLRAGPEITAQTAFGRRMMLTLHDRLGGEVFSRFSQLNHADNTFDAQFDLLLGPVLLTTEGGFGTTRWRPNRGPNNDFTTSVRQNDSNIKETVRVFAGPFTDVVVAASRGRFSYISDGKYASGLEGAGDVTLDTLLDRDQTEITGEVGWHIRPRTRVFGRYVQRASRFNATIGNYDRDTDQASRLLGVEFSASARISGRLLVGKTKLDTKDARFSSYDGVVAQTQLVYRPTGTSRITVSWERQPYFSTFDRNLYYLDTWKALALDLYIGAFWGVQGGYSVRDGDYPEPASAIYGVNLPAGSLRKDRTSDYYMGVLLRTKRAIEIGLRFGRRQRDSNYLAAVDDLKYFSTTGSYAF